MQVGQDAGLAALDDVAAEALEIAGPGRADVEPGGRPAAAGELVGVDPERGPAPVDVGVEVDHARHDDAAGGIVDGSTVLEPGPTAATLPPANATSATASMPWPGSITRPPRSTRS